MRTANRVPALLKRIALLERAIRTYHEVFAGHDLGAHPEWCIGCEAIAKQSKDRMDELAESARELNEALDAQKLSTNNG